MLSRGRLDRPRRTRRSGQRHPVRCRSPRAPRGAWSRRDVPAYIAPRAVRRRTVCSSGQGGVPCWRFVGRSLAVVAAPAAGEPRRAGGGGVYPCAGTTSDARAKTNHHGIHWVKVTAEWAVSAGPNGRKATPCTCGMAAGQGRDRASPPAHATGVAPDGASARRSTIAVFWMRPASVLPVMAYIRPPTTALARPWRAVGMGGSAVQASAAGS